MFFVVVVEEKSFCLCWENQVGFSAWISLLGVKLTTPLELEGHLKSCLEGVYKSVLGWVKMLQWESRVVDELEKLPGNRGPRSRVYREGERGSSGFCKSQKVNNLGILLKKNNIKLVMEVNTYLKAKKKLEQFAGAFLSAEIPLGHLPEMLTKKCFLIAPWLPLSREHSASSSSLWHW